jgi:BirA family biotin operon repressor/biotin-[acetyl-CoA-carboxylase] ligase
MSNISTDFERVTISEKLKVIRTEILHVKTIDSTNSRLLDNDITENGIVLLADYQTAGRGRFDRRWESPAEEALLFSVLLTDIKPGRRQYIYTFLAAVAVYSALRRIVPSEHHLVLKWPNDVLLNGKKLCGILVQGKLSGTVQKRLVIGIGININQPEKYFNGQLSRGISLYSATGHHFDRFQILTAVLKHLDEQLNVLQDNGESLILHKWKDACDSIGDRIKVDNGQEMFAGVFKDIDENGALILFSGEGEMLFHAGDVTILHG